MAVTRHMRTLSTTPPPYGAEATQSTQAYRGISIKSRRETRDIVPFVAVETTVETFYDKVPVGMLHPSQDADDSESNSRKRLSNDTASVEVIESLDLA
jgi:hypothetical protein